MVLPGRGLSWKQFFVDLKNEWSSDDLADVAAALTFFGVLALFPFLIFLVSLASLVIDPDQAQALVDELSTVAPQEVTAILGERIRALGAGGSAGLLTVSGVGAIWAASGGVVALMRALNTIYDVDDDRPFLEQRGIAIAATLIGAVISLAAAVIAVATPAIAGQVGQWVGSWAQTAVLWLRLPVAGLLMMFVWALLYWALPNVEQKFKFITPGSIVGVIIWVAASWGFSKYVQNFGNYDATYGALASVIVLLFWMWISSIVLMLGAEINAILEHRSPEGKRAGAKRMAESGADRPKGQRAEEEDARRLPSPAAVGRAVPVSPLDERRQADAALLPRDAGPPRPRGLETRRRRRQPRAAPVSVLLGTLLGIVVGRRFGR